MILEALLANAAILLGVVLILWAIAVQIKDVSFIDSFWGAGARARGIAGGMSARGSALILLPIGSAARLTGR